MWWIYDLDLLMVWYDSLLYSENNLGSISFFCSKIFALAGDNVDWRGNEGFFFQIICNNIFLGISFFFVFHREINFKN